MGFTYQWGKATDSEKANLWGTPQKVQERHDRSIGVTGTGWGVRSGELGRPREPVDVFRMKDPGREELLVSPSLRPVWWFRGPKGV